MTRWQWVVVAVLLVAVVVIKRSYADDDSDRQTILNEIQRLLNDAASDLDGVASDSGGSDIENARSRVRDVKSKLSALDRVKGSDTTANKYVSDYPRLCDDFDRAAQILLQLKSDQRSVSEQARRCQDLERPMVEKANEMEREKDGARIEELRRLALDVGGKAEDWWRDVERKKSEMQSWASSAQQFSASDAWSGVSSKVQAAATGMMSSWLTDYAAADAACKDLRQRDRHPVIDRALRELANTAQGKDQLYVRLDEKLKRIESLFKDVFGDSSTSKVDDALSTMSEVDALVRQVDVVKGADRKAKHIAEQWPSYVSTFDSPARSLRTLKHTQRDLDTAEPRCKTDEDALRDAMKKALAARDPDALVEIPAMAQKHGEFFTRSLAWMERERYTIAGHLSTVNAFDPRDDRWAPLKAAMQAAAKSLFDYREEQAKRIHSTCDNLAKGDRHPEVESFMRELSSVATNDLATYQKDGAVWEADARGIYILDCKDMQEMWDAWCAVEFEPNEEPEDSLVEQKTAEFIDKESRLIDGVLARVPSLVEAGKKLAAKAKYREGANAVLQEIEKHRERLEKLKRKNSNWRGNNNPASQFAKTYGQKVHDKMGADFRCNLYDTGHYPTLKPLRPDCVVVKGKDDCWVYEFKPRGWVGEDKLPKYVRGVREYHEERMRRNEDASSELGGHAFQSLVEANCRADYSKDKKVDILKFKTDTEPYDRCAQRYVCEQ